MVAVVDDFNRADALSLGTTSDGNAIWTDVGGAASVEAQIISNTVALPLGVSGDRRSTIPGGTAGTVQITATAVTLSNDSVGVLFRYQDANNYFYALVGTSGAIRYRVFKKIAGSVSQLFSGGGAVGDLITVDFTATGYTAKRNGTGVFSQTNSELNTATDVGLVVSGSGVATQQPKGDDFSWTPLVIPPRPHRPLVATAAALQRAHCW